jgi:hypothetical protein
MENAVHKPSKNARDSRIRTHHRHSVLESRGYKRRKHFISKNLMAAEGMESHQSSVKTEVVDGAKTFVKESVVQAAVTKLVSMFIPGGGLIQAFMTGFDMIKFVINEGSRIASLVSSIVGSVSSIARGDVGGAIAKVESSLAKTIPLALSFLSRIFKVSGIGTKIKEIIKRIKGKIDAVVKKVMDKAAAVVAKMAAAVKPSATTKPQNGQSDNVETPQSRDVKNKVKTELSSRLPKQFKTSESVIDILTGVKSKYAKDGLKALKVERSAGKFNVFAKASPYSNVGITQADILFNKNDLEQIFKRRQVVLRAVINGKAVEQSFQSSKSGHAEENFVKVITSALPKTNGTSKNKVIVQLSSSPCGDPKEDEKLKVKLHNCSATLAHFAKEHNVELTVQVLGVYSPSVQGGKAASVEGLKHMLEHGVRVEAWKPDQAIANLEKQLGEKLDPEIESSMRSKLSNIIKEMEELSGKTL